MVEEVAVRIQIVSDIHAEFHQDRGKQFCEKLPVDGVAVLIVAGDLGIHFNLGYCLSILCQRVPHVVYVMGNHEFYHSTRNAILGILRRLKVTTPNLHVLENNSVTIDGQRFLGCSLWFEDVPESWEHRYKLNDFHIINGGFTDWFPALNQESRQYLGENVREDDIVVTHHIPTPKGSLPKWLKTGLNCFFVCDVEGIITRAQPKLWIYGHTHDSHDFTIGKTRLICNPFGYLRREENPGFDWEKIVEV